MTLEPGTETPASGGPAHDVGRDLDRLEQQFGLLFDSYRQRLKQRSLELDPALQPSGYRTLATLVQLGPSGAGTLADALGYDKSVLSRQLHQLEELGFVTRVQDPADRRAVIISATPEAVVRVKSINADERDVFRSRIAAWERSDLDDLIRLLAKLADE